MTERNTLLPRRLSRSSSQSVRDEVPLSSSLTSNAQQAISMSERSDVSLKDSLKLSIIHNISIRDSTKRSKFIDQKEVNKFRFRAMGPRQLQYRRRTQRF